MTKKSGKVKKKACLNNRPEERLQEALTPSKRGRVNELHLRKGVALRRADRKSTRGIINVQPNTEKARTSFAFVNTEGGGGSEKGVRFLQIGCS